MFDVKSYYLNQLGIERWTLRRDLPTLAQRESARALSADSATSSSRGLKFLILKSVGASVASEEAVFFMELCRALEFYQHSVSIFEYQPNHDEPMKDEIQNHFAMNLKALHPDMVLVFGFEGLSRYFSGLDQQPMGDFDYFGARVLVYESLRSVLQNPQEKKRLYQAVFLGHRQNASG